MSSTTDMLAARADIQDLLFRYCRGIDRTDVELVKSVYHPGATDDHGVFTGDGYEFAEFVVPLLRATYSCTQHQLSNMLIDIDLAEGRARAETYFVAYHVERSPDPDTGRAHPLPEPTALRRGRASRRRSLGTAFPTGLGARTHVRENRRSAGMSSREQQCMV